MIKKVELIGCVVLIGLLGAMLATFSIKKPDAILSDTDSPVALTYAKNQLFKLSLLIDSLNNNQISQKYVIKDAQKIVKEITHARSYTERMLKQVAQLSEYGKETEINIAQLKIIEQKAQGLLKDLTLKPNPPTRRQKKLTALEEEI